MWIARYEWDALKAQVARLERQNRTHADFLHKDYEKLKAQEKSIERINETVGMNNNDPTIYDSIWSGCFEDMYGLTSPFGRSRVTKREAKSFNLQEKISAIMDHLNLTEQVTAETKLITKPVEKKKKGKK